MQACMCSCVLKIYLEDLLDMRATAEGGGGLSGLVGVACRCISAAVGVGGWEWWDTPQEALLLDDAFLW